MHPAETDDTTRIWNLEGDAMLEKPVVMNYLVVELFLFRRGWATRWISATDITRLVKIALPFQAV